MREIVTRTSLNFSLVRVAFGAARPHPAPSTVSRFAVATAEVGQRRLFDRFVLARDEKIK